MLLVDYVRVFIVLFDAAVILLYVGTAARIFLRPTEYGAGRLELNTAIVLMLAESGYYVLKQWGHQLTIAEVVQLVIVTLLVIAWRKLVGFAFVLPPWNGPKWEDLPPWPHFGRHRPPHSDNRSP